MPATSNTRPWFLLLLPLFFVFHGWAGNFHFVSEKTAVLLFVIYSFSAIGLAFLFYLVSKKILHAAIMAAIVIGVHFFFGPLHDAVKELFGPLLTKYSYFLIVLLILVILLWFLLRKMELKRIAVYLNLLFLLLITLDVILLFFQGKKKDELSISSFIKENKVCDTCKKPDIFFIILDGYAGSRQLSQQFSFSNAVFFDALKKSGFKVIDESNSNYDSSPTSVASLFNMEYLDSNRTAEMRKTGHKHAFDKINKNKLTEFLIANGYVIYNNSVFRLAGKPSPTGGSFIPSNAKLVNGNTLIARLEKDVLMNVATKLKLNFYLKKYIYAAQKDNNRIYELTVNAAKENNRPKFVYAHFMMPHHPYYNKADGSSYTFDELVSMPYSDKGAYLSYLQYTNQKILDLVNAIIRNSSSSPVIAVLSDHGFRYFQEGKYEDYAFSNLLSIRLPSGDYRNFPDTMTNVNFFSSLLNTQFGLDLSMKKDSSAVIEF
jgi:hypothetical protein